MKTMLGLQNLNFSDKNLPFYYFDILFGFKCMNPVHCMAINRKAFISNFL